MYNIDSYQRIEWPAFITICENVAKEIKGNYSDLTNFGIVTTIKQGLIPATIIAYHLGIDKIYPITHDGNICTKNLPDEDVRLFFIDAVLNTGKTFDMIRDKFFNYDVKYVFTIAKQLVPGTMRELPGTCFIGLWVDNKWIILPWEQRVK